jgi:hypothetical protein
MSENNGIAKIEQRQCPVCGNFYPLTTEFWHKKGDGFHTICKEDRNAMKLKREAMDSQDRCQMIEQRVLDSMVAMSPGGASIPHTAELVEAICEGFGGVRDLRRLVLPRTHKQTLEVPIESSC